MPSMPLPKGQYTLSMVEAKVARMNAPTSTTEGARVHIQPLHRELNTEK